MTRRRRRPCKNKRKKTIALIQSLSAKEFKDYVQRKKCQHSAGYELMKKDPNRPPTPVYQHNNTQETNVRYVKWLECLKKHCFSEETEISPEQCKVMIEALKIGQPYLEYNKVFPQHDLELGKYRVKSPVITDWVRGDEWEEMSSKWLKEINQFKSSSLYKKQKRNFLKLEEERSEENISAKNQKLSGEQPSVSAVGKEVEYGNSVPADGSRLEHGNFAAGTHMEHGNFAAGTHMEDGNFEGPESCYEDMYKEQYFPEKNVGPGDYHEGFKNDLEYFEEVNNETPCDPEVPGISSYKRPRRMRPTKRKRQKAIKAMAFMQTQRIANEKVSNSAGYELMKKDPNRPPTPIYQHDNLEVNAKANVQFVKWLECLKKHCFSKETEISPKQCKAMMKGLKKGQPYDEYNKVFPQNDVELRKYRVKSPVITDWVQGHEWEEISTKWLKEIKQFTHSSLYQMQKGNFLKLEEERSKEKIQSKKQKLTGEKLSVKEKIKSKKQNLIGEQPSVSAVGTHVEHGNSEPADGTHMEHGNFAAGTHMEDGNFEGPESYYEDMYEEQYFETRPVNEAENFEGPDDYHEGFKNDLECFEEVNDEIPHDPEVSGAMFRVDMIVQGSIFNKIPGDRRPVIPRPEDFMTTANYLIAVENFEMKVAVEKNIMEAQNEQFEKMSQVSHGSDHEMQDMQIEQEEEEPEIQVVSKSKLTLGKFILQYLMGLEPKQFKNNLIMFEDKPQFEFAA